MATSKNRLIAGWVLSGLLALFLICLSAPGKFMDFPGKEEMFSKMGFANESMYSIGVLEIVITILFLIPRTAFIGAILLTGYLGGAVATHVRILENPAFVVVIGVLVWIALGLRQPAIFSLAIGETPKA